MQDKKTGKIRGNGCWEGVYILDYTFFETIIIIKKEEMQFNQALEEEWISQNATKAGNYGIHGTISNSQLGKFGVLTAAKKSTLSNTARNI